MRLNDVIIATNDFIYGSHNRTQTISSSSTSFIRNLKKRGSDDRSRLPFKEYTLTMWTDVPVVSDVKPLSGSIAGYTTVTLKGSLKNVLACRFSSGTSSYVAPAVKSNSEDEVKCLTPRVEAAGTYLLDLKYGNKIWISTKYLYSYFHTPVFFSRVHIPLKGPHTDTDIYGQLFPASQVYCKMIYFSSHLLLSGMRISSNHIRCLMVGGKHLSCHCMASLFRFLLNDFQTPANDGSVSLLSPINNRILIAPSTSNSFSFQGVDDISSRGLVKSFQVSFNGFDFTDIEIHFIKPRSESYLILDTPVEPFDRNDIIAPIEELLPTITLNQICNGR